MPRGGKRQGTPGTGYANRTDLASNPDMSKNTAASGGMTGTVPQAPQAQFPMAYPEDSPGLLDPTQRPDEDLMEGIGQASMPEQAKLEGQMFAPYLPMLIRSANMDNAAPTFVRFVRALRGAQ